MPVRTTPEQAQAKWVQRIQAASQSIADGVARVQVAPGQKAAAKSQKWLQNTQAAADKWRRNVAAVSLQDWQRLMTDVGIPRIADGAQKKQAKYGAFAQQFFTHLQAGVAKVEAMPDTTFEERIQRAITMMRHNKTFQRQSSSITG